MQIIMKTLLANILLFLFAINNIQAQNGYFIPPKGKILVYYVKTPTGKISTTKQYLKPMTTPNSFTIVNLSSSATNQPESSCEITFTKEGNYLYSDFKSIFCDLRDTDFHIDAESSSKKISFPLNPKVGETLESYSLKLTFKDNDQTIPMTLLLRNRKVISEESVTTNAGTFNCIRIDYDIVSEIPGMQMTTNVQTWYAKNIGLVKMTTSIAQQGITTITELEKIEEMP